MNTKTTLSIGRLLATATLILGVIHDTVTFTPLVKEGLSCLDTENLNAVIYFSLICGTSLILSGIILLLLLNKVCEYPFLRTIFLIIGSFLALNGILSVVCMSDNAFAWTAMLLNLGMLGISIKLNISSKNRVSNNIKKI